MGVASMKEKNTSLKDIPLDIQAKIASQLSNHDLFHYSLASTKHFNFFKNLRDVRSLLRNVVQGKHVEVEAILRQNINLIFERGRVIDCSARTFKYISPFEYAVWALDISMCQTMLGCLPKDNKSIIKNLLLQYEQLHTEGITYWLNQNKFTEQHFDLENTLIKELRIQQNLLKTFGTKNLGMITNLWRKNVGGAQKLLPMNFVVAYYAPAFNALEQDASQAQAQQNPPLFNLMDYIFNKKYPKITLEEWFTHPGLGVKFAVFRGKAKVARQSEDPVCNDLDLNALLKLHKTRMQEFFNLRLQLEKMMDNTLNDSTLLLLHNKTPRPLGDG
jgi:hypothetical protein